MLMPQACRAAVPRRRCGFTLIELLIVMAIVGVLLMLAVPRYYDSVKRSEEAVLRQNLAMLRESLDKHFADTGRYPATLEELVTRRYLRRVPVDPITGAHDTWTLVPPPDAELGRIYDVKSGAPGAARDGSAFDSW
jgi:general secretion pathway protein G